MRSADYVWRSYGRKMGWSYDKCELLVDEYHDDMIMDDKEDFTEPEEEE